MTEMQVSLPDSIGEFAGAQVASCRFTTMNDYLGALVSADAQWQKALSELGENPHLAALLEDGLDSEPGRQWTGDVLSELKQQVVDRAAGKNR